MLCSYLFSHLWRDAGLFFLLLLVYICQALRQFSVASRLASCMLLLHFLLLLGSLLGGEDTATAQCADRVVVEHHL